MVHLPRGTRIDNFIVGQLLGEGSFGAVYEVTSKDGSEKHALKVESTKSMPQVLRMEVQLLNTLDQLGFLRHFCRIHGKGRETRQQVSFNYVIMTLVGKSIQDLRMMSPAQHFNINTAVGVGIQSLEALQDLHSIGYLHRDVKPSNIATGRAEIGELQKIYMLDFGMARKYVKEDHPPFTIRHARERAEFRGTVRYAAISCHIGREQSRKDDCESWLYTLIELTNGRLPWCEEDMAQAGNWKQTARSNPILRAQLFEGCPAEYSEIMNHIDSLRYYDMPDYDKIFNLLRRSLASRKLAEHPYDWVDRRWPNVKIKRS
uniref:Protein kinase domain-containing protein n=1 Tax=Acrobeloides nanus TaxID=290746 RepID=A0A914DM66_9BILA